jgi:hypothetical protein
VPRGDVSLPRDQQYGFAISDIQVTFRGLCPGCAPQQPAQGPGPQPSSKAEPEPFASSPGARRTSAKQSSKP